MEKSVVKKILINVMLLLFVAVNGSAQFITGSITDRQGLPVEFANIVLLSVPDSSFLQGTVSDESGSFRIQTGDSIPKISIGKLIQEKKKLLLPISISVHHGLVDGRNVAEFIQNVKDGQNNTL